jgi:hypothetical protein
MDWIPYKAVDWLLFTHKYIREKIESDEFAIRPCVLEGLGGTGRVSASLPPDPVEDYELTKEKYLTILDAVDFALDAMEEFEFNIYWMKWQKRLAVKEICNTFRDPRNALFTPTSIRTINRRIEFIRGLVQALVSTASNNRDVLSMMRRFGTETKGLVKEE